MSLVYHVIFRFFQEKSAMITVSQINIYPLKSAAPISFEEAIIGRKGVDNDRNWMLIDDKGVALTARDCPDLLKVESHLTESGITFSAPNREPIELTFPGVSDTKVAINIWSVHSLATLVSDMADKWFSEYLKTNCQLVYLRQEDVRVVEAKVGGQQGDVVSFADENPLLLITESSLAELNGRLDNPVTMLNFRPNVVVNGSDAFAEDDWNQVQISDSKYRVAQACKRCILTTIDPKQAQIKGDGEPLKTLAKFRYDRDRSGVLFGIHLIPESEYSEIKIGDRLTLLS